MDAGLRAHGLRKQHVKLLQILLNGRGSNLTARQLSRAAELPLNRTYQALRELNSLGLIEKRLGPRMTFSPPNSGQAFRKFFSARTEQLLASQQTLLDMIAELGIRGRELEVLPNRHEFYQAIYQLFGQASSIKILSRSHWGILPDREPCFWRNKAWHILKSKIENGTEVHYLVDVPTLRRGIDRWNATVVHSNIRWLLSQPSVRLAAGSVSNMTSTIITPEGAIIGFRHAGEHLTAKGVIVRSRDFMHFFNGVYDSIFNCSRDFHGLEKT